MVAWARAQNHLGGALRYQAERSEGPEAKRLLVEVVTAYRAALEVYTEGEFPRRYAGVLSNLKVAERDLQKLKP